MNASLANDSSLYQTYNQIMDNNGNE